MYEAWWPAFLHLAGIRAPPCAIKYSRRSEESAHIYDARDGCRDRRFLSGPIFAAYLHTTQRLPLSPAVGAAPDRSVPLAGLSFPLLTPMLTLGNQSAQGQTEGQVCARGKKEADIRHQLGARPHTRTTSSSSH